MYVCGPTVYDLPHLGHGRYTLVWDMARRWFTFQGYEVDFVSNITDIDDNIIARAARESTTEAAVARTYEDLWWEAMDALGVARPTASPHATEYVTAMVALIEELLGQDVAYQTGDGVYFDVSRVPDYGLLAGQPLDSLRAGARVEANDAKRSPLDFALWKSAKPGEPSWPAPFGPGRPGWHTECVVMSLGLLGEGFDLHCGGQDLRFPHHENERAQAVASGRVFARHWDHSGWVMVGDEKMSKSLGNFTSLTDLLATADARAYRLLVLRSHYRSPIEVSVDTIADAERALARLDALARRFDLPVLAGPRFEEKGAEWASAAEELYRRVAAFLDEDLNTPPALGLLFEAVSATSTAQGSWRRPSQACSAPSGWRWWPRARRSTTRSRPWSHGATRPAAPGTGPKRTACATSWWPGAGSWRIPLTGPGSATPKFHLARGPKAGNLRDEVAVVVPSGPPETGPQKQGGPQWL